MGPQTAAGNGSGREKLGGRQEGKEEREGGWRQNEKQGKRETHTETHAERWGDRGRATEKQRGTETEECMGDSAHTLRDRNIHMEMERE